MVDYKAMTDAELTAMVEKAAEEGAKRALRSIGLQDETAMSDVRDLRSLLDAWRLAKKTVLTTIVKALVVAFLAAIGTGVAILSWPGK
jgi:basic membrane lipoprotein Med (substrate-binding protein (PBP1-ABC) superfamily)